MNGASGLIVASSVEADDAIEAGVSEFMVRTRPNGVAFEDLLPLPRRGDAREAFGIPPDAPLVLTLARIGAIKGLPTFARSLEELKDVWWLLAGPDERDGTLASVRAAVDQSGVSDRVVIEPHGLWGEAKRQALADADVFCLPSDYESFGTAALEAAGVGLPVVMTERCGARDVLVGPSYPRARVGDPSSLARAVSEQLKKQPRMSRAEDASSLRERLNWVAVAALQLDIYSSSNSG
jgi:glycosyltransferase involved in cell wall biosynthesis